MTENSSPIISIRDATVCLPKNKQWSPVLDGINLELFPGRHTVIYGPNGAGKSTLLRLMHGELPLQSGSATWRQNGAPDHSRITGQEITGLVSPHTQAHWQIYGQGICGYELLNRTAPEATDMINAVGRRLETTAIFHEPLCRLSQGQLRLLLLIQAILRQPPVLLLDEWADGLDHGKRRLMLNLLSELSQRITMVFTSHREGDIPPFVHQRMLLEGGRFVERLSTPDENHANAESGSRTSAPAACQPISNAGEAIFTLSHAYVYKERRLLLNDISWRVQPGENWRITGANGAGKSTLLRLLAGEEFVAAGGRFRHFSPRLGRNAETLAERKSSAPLVSDLGQAMYGYPVSALELVLTGLDMAEGIHHEYGTDAREQARILIHRFLPDIDGGRCIRQLSSGQLRRLFLARALMGQPDVLLLDEPCTGLDAPARQKYVSLVRRLVSGEAPQPLQLVLVTHDDEDFGGIPFRIAHMEAGRLKVV